MDQDPLFTIPKSTVQALVDAFVETKLGKAAYLLGSTLKVQEAKKPHTEGDILKQHQRDKLNLSSST